MKGSGSSGSRRPGNKIDPPTLAGHMRRMRKRIGLSQRELADTAGVSPSYVQKLETNRRDGLSLENTVSIADTLGLEGVDRRTLFYLCGFDPVGPVPDVDVLRGQLTDRQRRELNDREPDLLAYFDQRWNLLDCNTPYDYAFPGMAAAGNVILWYFGVPAAKQVLLQWPREAALNVAWFRGLLARHHPSPWSERLITELEKYPEFLAMWHATDDIVYGRDVRDAVMHLLDPVSGEPYTLCVEQYPITSHEQTIYKFVGIRQNEFVPPLPPPRARRDTERGRAGLPRMRGDLIPGDAATTQRTDDSECA